MTTIILPDEMVPVPLTTEQAEREALAERIMLAMLQHDGEWASPNYLADEAFRVATAFIARRNEERSK